MLEQFLPVEGKSIHKVFKQEFVPPTIARSRLGAVSISGRGFTPFRQIVIGRDTCGWPPPPVAATDINGDCETEFYSTGRDGTRRVRTNCVHALSI